VAPVNRRDRHDRLHVHASGQPAPGDPGANDAFCAGAARSASRPAPTRSAPTRCPRLGLVTLVAATKGQEGYVDANANGQYDVGENFTDIGEPYVDVNGQWPVRRRRTVLRHQRQRELGRPERDVGLGHDDAGRHVTSCGPGPRGRPEDLDHGRHPLHAVGEQPNITTPNTLSVALYLRDENLNPVAASTRARTARGPRELRHPGLDHRPQRHLGAGEEPARLHAPAQPERRRVPHRRAVVPQGHALSLHHHHLLRTTGAYTVGFQTVLSPGRTARARTSASSTRPWPTRPAWT